jgi:hypothetical protein
MAGVPIPDIMVQGNWSNPRIFEKHIVSPVSSRAICLFHIGDPSGATFGHNTINNDPQASYRGRTNWIVIGAMDKCPTLTALFAAKMKIESIFRARDP